MFSFYVSGLKGKSFIDIGEIQKQNIKYGAEIAWIDMEGEFYWMSNQGTGIRFDT